MRAPRFVRRTLAHFAWSGRDADMSEEMRHHLDALTEDLVQSGLPPDAAAAEARRRFGSVLRIKEAGHDERRAPLVEHLIRDVRHMARGLRRSPGFAAAVILTLGVGIGGNTAIFSVVDQVLLRPLPYPDGERLAIVFEQFDTTGPSLGVNRSAPCSCVSPANWLDCRAWRPPRLETACRPSAPPAAGPAFTGAAHPKCRTISSPSRSCGS